ncbi:MAG TPA: hypothetical protein VJ921_01670 [Vicinamibacteria bacterium]|nr:hypothetical protein [Vicinamibacteria bacterium]
MRARHAVTAVAVGAAAIAALTFSLRLSPSIDLRLGPSDRDYAQGFSSPFRFDGELTYRSLEGRGRAALPLRVREGGTLEILARCRGGSPAALSLRFDDGTTVSVTVPPSEDFRPLRWEIPRSRMRAHVRLRSEDSPLDVAALRWEPRGLLLERDLALAAGILGALSYLAFAAAGLRWRASLAGAACLVAALAVLARIDGFAAMHLARRLPWAAALGLSLVGIARIAAATVPLRALLFVALLFKAGLLFHPRYHFFDWQIHETLLELLYHRGAADFRSRLVDYQLAHNVGVGQVGGEPRVFPYPVLFYYTAHLGNRLHHAPELWLKLTAAGFAAAALLPLGFLARKLDSHPRTDLFAAIAYLLVPSLTRSLLLLELSAVAGCFFDLLAVAVLAALNLALRGPRRFAAGTLAMSASLAAYTAGFVHIGLLVASALLLAVAGLWDRRDALRLAIAGVLALALSLLAYHPKAISALATALVAQESKPAESAPPPSNLAGSAIARARTFLGIPLIAAGTVGLFLGLRRLAGSSLRALYLAWALSALIAYGLRYVFIDLFQYQKELYWMAALLAVGVGGLASTKRRPLLAAVVVAAALVFSYALELREMAGQFFRDYLFL